MDCLAIAKKIWFDSILEFMNGVHPNIKFTHEHAKDGTIGFLDVLIVIKDGQVQTSVYRKPCHTDQYLNYHSNHTITHKSSVVRSLARRAFLYCSTQVALTEELDHIKMALLANDYPLWFINKYIDKSLASI